MSNVRKNCPWCYMTPRCLQEGGYYYMKCENLNCVVQPKTKLALDRQTALIWWNRRLW